MTVGTPWELVIIGIIALIIGIIGVIAGFGGGVFLVPSLILIFSVPANIAEGFKKRTLKDKANFYNIAQGSLEELRYYFILVKDLGFMKENQGWLNAVEEIGRMLYGLIKSIQ